MKKIIYFLFLLFMTSCANNKGVYWCGDHPCINNSEKEAFFKKTMIVEVRQISNKTIEEDSEMKKLLNQAKDEERERVLNEKDLAKQIRLDEKRRIKEEKKLAKQIRLDEKRKIKEEKKLTKKTQLKEEKTLLDEKKIKIPTPVVSLDPDISSNQFNILTERIFKRNINRSYPKVDDIAN